MLAGLYYFYHNSALNRAVLQKTYEATKSQDEKLLIPTRVGGTRWIGHQVTAITHVITSYKFIVTHMEQDVLAPLHHLSLNLQDRLH